MGRLRDDKSKNKLVAINHGIVVKILSFVLNGMDLIWLEKIKARVCIVENTFTLGFSNLLSLQYVSRSLEYRTCIENVKIQVLAL